MNAALTLADKGFASTVYEASTRIGGRMHSDTSGYFDNGQVSEFCGELIDTGHMTIRHLAQRFSLQTVDLLAAEPNGSDDTYWFLGGYYPKDQADKDFQPIHKTLQSQVQATSYPTTYLTHTDAGVFFDQMTIYDWIEQYVPGGHKSRMGRLLDAAYNIEYGAETKDQAALNLIYLLALPGSRRATSASTASRTSGSTSQAATSSCRTRSPTTSAGRTSSSAGRCSRSRRTPTAPYRCRSRRRARTQTVTADHVILTLPFAVLRTLDYSGANFDSLKKTAITQLGAGKNGKLQLQFKTR